MDELRPTPGNVIEVGDDVDCDAIGELIGFEFDEEIDEPDPINGVSLPAVLESDDDGKSFRKHEHPFTGNWIFGLHKWQGEKALLGGVDGLVLGYA